MDYYSGAPEPSDYEYNNGGQGSSGGDIMGFFKKNSFLVLVLLAAIIAVLIVIFLLTTGGDEHNYDNKDKDSSLKELYISGGIIEPMFEPDVIKYRIVADSEFVTFTCEASSKKAKVEGCDDSVFVEDYIDVSADERFNIKVTAEDGNITRYYFTFIKSEDIDY